MFTALKAHFLTEHGVFPMVLVLTDQQYDRLPRSFDDLRDRLTVEKVATPKAAESFVDQLADWAPSSCPPE